MSASLRIVLFVNSFLPHVGGREVVVHELAKALVELGHQVRVVGPAGWRRFRRYRFPYPVHRWPTLHGFLPEETSLVQLLFHLALWGCDVIHAHNTYPTGFVAARLKSLAWRGRPPLVVTPHGEDIHVVPEINRGLRLQPKLEKKIRYALQQAEMVTAISSSVRASLLDAGAASDKTRVVPNGVDIARFGRVAQVNVRRMLDLPADAKIILTVGNYGTFRGHEYLVHATRQLLGDEPRARLVIVGRDTEVLRPLIRELGLDDKVVLTGAIAYPMAQYAPPDEERGLGNDDLLAAIFAQSNVYVSAGIAEGSEGLSLALLEAMAAGLPIVATEISGNRDVIRDGQSGVLVAPGSPDGLAHGIRRVLANREAACKLRDAARKIGQTYAWRQIALQYVEVYREAAERRRASK